jgi:hypothetical protein
MEETELPEDNIESEEEVEVPSEAEEAEEVEEIQEIEQDILPGKSVSFELDGIERSGEVLSYNPQDGFAVVKLDTQSQEQSEEGEEIQSEEIEGQPIQDEMEVQVHESKIKVIGDRLFENEISIKETITNLITEAKKRKAAEEQQPHFLMFLSENNKKVWNDLSLEDKEKINIAINESNYSSEKEVLGIIRESLSTPQKTEEEILIDSIPNDLIDTWNSLNDSIKKSVLASAKYYPNITKTQELRESFWNSRGLEQYSKNPKKVLLNENKNYVNDSKLSNNQVDRFLDAFKNLS